jgi:ribosomal protein L11 methyltransferase
MPWLQLRIQTSAELAGDCEDALLAQGAAAVTFEDSADEPLYSGGREDQREYLPLWQSTRVTGLFPATTDTAAIWEALPARLRKHCDYRAELLEDKDWEREWMQHYQPTRYGNRLWVCPSWIDTPEPDAINLSLDPGLAFGTGTHPTTAMCLERLSGENLDGAGVIDYGCGSGILAIAAGLLGASPVHAVDNDPQALKACSANAERNGLSGSQLLVYRHGELPASTRANLLVANILAGPLQDLAPLLCRHLRPGGTLLLSGILSEQADPVAAAYATEVELDIVASRDGWVLLAGRRR